MNHDDPQALVTLVTVTTSFEAHTIASVLTDAGIEAKVFDAAHTGLGVAVSPGSRGVPIQVRRCDAEPARIALRANVSDSVDIDWDAVELGEREDSLPPGTPGRMPIPARVAFAVAVTLVLMAIVFSFLTLFY